MSSLAKKSQGEAGAPNRHLAQGKANMRSKNSIHASKLGGKGRRVSGNPGELNRKDSEMTGNKKRDAIHRVSFGLRLGGDEKTLSIPGT
jgi:hypothetical protein